MQTLSSFHPKGLHVSVLISLGIQGSIGSASIATALAFKLANKIPTWAFPHEVQNDLPSEIVVRPPVRSFEEGACNAIVIPILIMGTNPLVTSFTCHFSSLPNDVTEGNSSSTKLRT